MDRPKYSVPPATVERLSAYRHRLAHLLAEGQSRVYSHDLAALGQVTPAQVRRDLRTIAYAGSPAHGYDIAGLLDRIGEMLNPPADEGVALVGVGHLGRVVLNYLTARRPAVQLIAAFDNDPAKVGRVLHGVRCYALDELPRVASERAIRLGVLTVPAGVAQDVTRTLTQCGVRGILNFAPLRLRVPPGVYVENVDIATLLAKAAFFARQLAGTMEERT